MVDGGGLENRCTGNRIGGSNPSPSANSALAELSGGRGIQASRTGTPVRLGTNHFGDILPTRVGALSRPSLARGRGGLAIVQNVASALNGDAVPPCN